MRPSKVDLTTTIVPDAIRRAQNLESDHLWKAALSVLDLARAEVNGQGFSTPQTLRDEMEGVIGRWEADLDVRLTIVMRKLIPGHDCTDVIKELEELVMEAHEANFDRIANRARAGIESARNLGALMQLFKVSRRVAIADFCNHVGMTVEQILPILYEISGSLQFVIDGKYLELKGDDIDAVVAKLDKYFSDWTIKEKSKGEKLGS